MMKDFIKAVCALTIFCTCALASLQAAPFDSILNKNGVIEEVDTGADTYEYVGNNIIARGHVYIKFGNNTMTAERAVINLDSQDIDLSGNITFTSRVTVNQTFTEAGYEEALKDPYRIVKKIRTLLTPDGSTLIQASVTKNASYINAERAFMNVRTGSIQFKNFTLKEGITYAAGARAERHHDGSITLRDARFTTCNYLVDGNDHFALSAEKAVIRPPRQNSGLQNAAYDKGDVTLITKNSFLELWGVPVFWLPAFYKPAEAGGFGGRIEFGNDSDWGYYVRASKNVQIMDEPYLNADILLGYYEERGFGYGVSMDLMTPESITELFYYGIKDKSPYEYWDTHRIPDSSWRKNNSRLEIPDYRYEFRLANLTHLTPRLDFRAQIDVISDYNFLNDYFTTRYDTVLEPPTFISLEQQFDRATVSAYSTFRVNDFYTQLERLPEVRVDFQRQELFGGLYYQGETSLGYYRTKWRDFDRPRIYGNRVEPEDYESFRFDSLHMFYYPIKIWNINFIPRAGFRFTVYSDSSDQEITTQDLINMFRADAVDGQPRVNVVNYDDDGGSRVRFAGEIGFELNTKFYRTWQNVKSDYWGLDGLRHVVIPYINYTYIPEPTETPDHLYYFDEVDRIDENHFIRLGLINRLQTRRGNSIHEWFSMENYWDCFIYKADGFNNIGDFGTILRFNPTNNLTIYTGFLLDLGQSNDHDTPIRRGRRYTDDRPGLSWKYVNRWYAGIDWRFAPRWRARLNYSYTDEYYQRSAYSMGSTLSNVNASSLFTSAYTRGQDFSGRLDFPLWFDDTMNGYFTFLYDVDGAIWENIAVGITKRLHCWNLSAEFGRECERSGSDYDKDYSNYFAIYLSLAAMPGTAIGHKVEP